METKWPTTCPHPQCDSPLKNELSLCYHLSDFQDIHKHIWAQPSKWDNKVDDKLKLKQEDKDHKATGKQKQVTQNQGGRTSKKLKCSPSPTTDPAETEQTFCFIKLNSDTCCPCHPTRLIQST